MFVTPTQILTELLDILDSQSGCVGREADEQRVSTALKTARAWLTKYADRSLSETGTLIGDIVRALDTSDDALLDGAIQRARALPLQRLKAAVAHTTGPDDWAHVDAGALQWAIDALSGEREVTDGLQPGPLGAAVLDEDDARYVQERLDRASHYFVGDGSADTHGWQAGGEALGEAVERLAHCLAPLALTQATRGST